MGRLVDKQLVDAAAGIAPVNVGHDHVRAGEPALADDAVDEVDVQLLAGLNGQPVGRLGDRRLQQRQQRRQIALCGRAADNVDDAAGPLGRLPRGGQIAHRLPGGHSDGCRQADAIIVRVFITGLKGIGRV